MRLASYQRWRTVALLRRFARLAIAVGRMPSLLGRSLELPASGGHSLQFEEAITFVCDVERCLEILEPFGRRLVALCILEGYSEHETARLLRRSQSLVSRRLSRALDVLHALLVRRRLLPPLPALPEERRRR